MELKKVSISLAQLCDEFQERYKCSICLGLMVDPIQTYRGYSSCELCYKDAIRDDSKCPIDHELIDHPGSFFKDKAKEKEIQNLKCHCQNKESGCDWIGTIRDFQNHIRNCEYMKPICQYCNEPMTSEESSQHFTNCPGINKKGSCIFISIGCIFKANTEQGMKDHMEQNASLHQYLQSKQTQILHEANANMHEQMKEQLDNYKQKEIQYKQEINNLETLTTTLTVKLENVQKEFTQQIGDIQKQLSVVRVNEKTTTSNEKGETTSQGLLKEMAKSVTRNENNISDLDLRLQLHENTTYDGRILWKIDKYTHRKQQAITGKVTALHSAACFSSQYGYKFCARLYINGDGMGRGTHISLFIVLMRSEYDNLLEWPFNKQVKFTLINQENRQKDISEKLVPAKDSASFKKPVKEMNVASGCPLFAPIDRLESEGFILDDSLFIELKIE